MQTRAVRSMVRLVLLVALLLATFVAPVALVGAVPVWINGPTIGGGTPLQLPDGRIIVINRSSDPTDPGGSLFDPTSRSIRPIAHHPARTRLDAPTVLSDGRIFFSGGAYQGCIAPGCYTTVSDAYIYDPRADRWNAVTFLPSARNYHTAITLRDGSVLVVVGGGGGGVGAAGCYGGATTLALRYDPPRDVWVETGRTSFGYITPVLTLLTDGRVLATTGTTQGTVTKTPDFGEVYDPATGTWSRTERMQQAREGHTATLLPSTTVVVMS